MLNTSTLTASDARSDFYNIVRKASRGLRSFEIKLRGSEPVVLIGKEELEGWLETLDIMANPEEVKAIAKAKKEKSTVSLQNLLKQFELESMNEKGTTQKKRGKRTS